MFNKILIANRGEIALRIINTCKEMNIKTVAVYSTADADSLHVKFADEAVCIGPPQSTESYLSIPKIISAAEITVGLILSVARNIVSANISMKNGEWNRSDFMGIELFEKQLGLVGFGKVGNLVAERMLAFGMKIGIYDPYIGTIDEPYTRFESLD